MANKRTFYALAPNGVIHRVATASLNDMRSIQAFGRFEIFHLFQVKEDRIVDAEIEAGLFAKSLGALVKHPIQNAFLEANGSFVDHASPKAFFDAIGFTEATKKLCKTNERKFIRASTLGEGKFACVDDRPYRVALTIPAV